MLLSPKDRHATQERLKRMQGPVRLIHFTQSLDCPACADAERLLGEVAQLSGKLTLEVLNLRVDGARAAQYGIERAPATVIESEKDYGIRIYGLPAGYEFAVLIETILLVSGGRSGLDAQTSAALAELRSPARLQVFSTATCPYCPAMAILAHQMAIESKLIRAELLDATEFPDLVRKHAIRGVPKTIINGAASIEGAVSAESFATAILQVTTPAKVLCT